MNYPDKYCKRNFFRCFALHWPMTEEIFSYMALFTSFGLKQNSLVEGSMNTDQPKVQGSIWTKLTGLGPHQWTFQFEITHGVWL